MARGFEWDDVRYTPRRIGDVVALKYGKALVERNRRPGPVPMFGTNGPCGWHDEPLAPGPGVILGRKGQGHLGVKWCNTDFWVIDTAYYASVDPREVDLRWFYYITNYVGLDHLKTGEKPGLSRDVFSRQLFPFPELVEQQSIARVLSTLDEKIEANRKLNETLEATCQTLFRSWFIDFDPVEAKSEGRNTPHLSEDVAALFPSKLVDTDDGPLPEGWRRGEVGAEFELVMGQSPPGSTYNEFGDGMPFYQGRTDFKERYPTRRIYCTAPTRLAQPGDTLVSVRAPVGDTNQALEACALGRGVAAVRHPREKPSFTYYQMGALREEFDIYNGYGTLFGSINKGDFAKLPLVVPPPELVDYFEDVASSLDAQLRNSSCESQTLAALRDALLPRLLSGELRVRQAEKLVEEAI